MSNSVFKESDPYTSQTEEECGEQQSNSDLVVVLAKDRIHVDSLGLERFIEHKTINSLSVIRLGSPTPSMLAEEEAQNALEGDAVTVRPSDSEWDDVSTPSETNDFNADSQNELAVDDHHEYDEQQKLKKNRAAKAKKQKKEVVGIIVEQVYDYKQARDILQLAIDPSQQLFRNLSFILDAIHNDHCYTNFRSPSEIKHKIEAAVKVAANNEKLSKQRKESVKCPELEDYAEEVNNTSNEAEAEEEGEFEESDYSSSIFKSSESDNDRDSDLDFRVNNNNSNSKTRRRKRKKIMKKARRQALVKQQHQHNANKLAKRQVTQNNEVDVVTPTATSSTIHRDSSSVKSRQVRKQWSNDYVALGRLQRMPQLVKAKVDTTPTSSVAAPVATSTGSKIPVLPTLNVRRILPNADVKEAPVISKVATKSPMSVAGVAAKPTEKVHMPQVAKTAVTTATTIITTTISVAMVTTTTASTSNTKVYMPVETVTAKSNLPAQISIQTQGNHAELAAENDKQLDLIDSILKHEMQRATTAQPSPPVAGDLNIPQIVKMLESTTVEQATKVNAATDAGTGDFMEALPADLLQHMADLICNDQELAAAMEKMDEDIIVDDMDNSNKIFEERELAVSSAELPVSKPNVSTTTITTTITTTTTSTSIVSAIAAPSTPAQKEPIQIVRGNRIITLPPMEAPTTRSRLRAQSTPLRKQNAASNAQNNVSLNASFNETHDMSALDASTTAVTATTTTTSSDADTSNSRKRARSTSKKKQVEKSTDAKDDDDDPTRLWCKCRKPHNDRFMICCDSCEEWFHGDCVRVSKHDGRIMEENGIDWLCESCVAKSSPRVTNLFKAKMAAIKRRMNNAANNSKKVANVSDTNKKAVDVAASSRASSAASDKKEAIKKTVVPAKNKSLTTSTTIQKATPKDVNLCIVCKKIAARVNTNYCTDECIKRHVQNALQPLGETAGIVSLTGAAAGLAAEDKTKKKNKSLFEECLTQADVTCKVERVPVYNRTTGHTITGNAAPTKTQVRKWLQDNASYEIIMPGSEKSAEIELKKQQLKQYKSSSHSPIIAQPKDGHNQKKQDKQPNSSSLTAKPTPTKANERKTERTRTYSESNDDGKSKSPSHMEVNATTSSEPVRQLVVRTLTEVISLRQEEMAKKLNNTNAVEAGGEANSEVHKNVPPKMSLEEIQKFVKQVEAEMLKVYQNENNPKYKNKYRSLLFNIKDNNNKTLYAKICGKQVTPKQLVHMSAADLASQELIQWRAREQQHTLEIIKKSELDDLSCNKSYLLKTHKGEKIIESNPIEWLGIDPTVPVNDVVTLLNNNGEQQHSTTNNTADITTIEEKAKKAKEPTAVLEEKSRHKDKSRDERKLQQERDREKRHHHSEKRHKNKDGHRSRSRDKRHKSSTHKHERSKESDKYKDKDKEKEEKKKDKHVGSTAATSNSTESKKSSSANKSRERKTTQQQTMPMPLETFSLVDQILESTKTVEEAANLVPEKKKLSAITTFDANITNSINTQVSSPTITSISSPSGMLPLAKTPLPTTPLATTPIVTAPIAPIPPASNVENMDELPTSTRTLPEDAYAAYKNVPPLWSGEINMVEVARFDLIIQPLVGNFKNLAPLLPNSLEIVGRIGPESVWDYLAKVKNNANKEIVVIQFLPTTFAENTDYLNFCDYLDSRERLGVFKATTPQIKDFYVMPLLAGKPLPQVLQSMEPYEFCNDMYRPNMLLGLAVRVIGSRRHAAPAAPPNHATTSSKHRHEYSTPPQGSPKRRKLDLDGEGQSPVEDDIDIDAIIKAPIANKSVAKRKLD